MINLDKLNVYFLFMSGIINTLGGDNRNKNYFTSDKPNSKIILTNLEQEIFDELVEIENKGEFDVGDIYNLKLLRKINEVKNGIKKVVLIKVRWYLKTLLALNLSDEETMNYLKVNLMELLDNDEQKYGRSLESPFLVGFNRDEKGKIVPIYGNRIFRSERNIDTSGMLMFGDDRREVALMSGAIKKIQKVELKKTDFWDLLPQDLRNIFENGGILQTTQEDFYDINCSHQKGAFACETQAETLEKIDENIQIGVISKQMQDGFSNYMLLYYGEYGNNKNGRTGVLVEMKYGKLEPVKVDIDGVEYILEIKGCGLRSGGFGKMQSRTGRKILSGGVEKDQAIEEFEVLNGISNGDGPKVAGIVLFNNSGYEQGQIIRLSPSTIRASYTGNKCYEDIESPRNVEKILDMYVKGFEEMLFSEVPRIISRSSHSENLLLWGNGNFCWTDYSDQLFLNSNRLPFNAEAGGFLTVKKLLFFVIEMKKEIPGYSDDRFKGVFIGKLIKYFKERGIELDININSIDSEITDEIWKKFLAYQTFRQKINFGFYPDKIEKDFEDKRKDFLGINKNSADFKRKIEELILKLKVGLQDYLKNSEQKITNEIFEKIKEVFLYIETGNYMGLLNNDYINNLYKVFFSVNVKITNLIINIILSLLIDFEDTILFLESEIDVLENAYNVANDGEKAIIQRGLGFYKSKIEYIKKVYNFELSLEEIYKFMEEFKFEELVFEGYKL